jgi:hypothetical protein
MAAAALWHRNGSSSSRRSEAFPLRLQQQQQGAGMLT